MVWNEYRERLLASKSINLHRYAPKNIYCSSLNVTGDQIELLKYDFGENKWNRLKGIPLGATRNGCGTIFLNGELYVMGGYAGDDYYRDVSVRSY